MKRLIRIAPVAAFLLQAGVTAASAEDAGYYISTGAGVSLLPDLHVPLAGGGTSHESFDAGYALGGGVGYDDGQGKRIELDSLYTLSNLDKLDGAPAAGHLRSTSLMIDSQMDLTHNTQLTPYIGAGLGFQNISARVGDFTGNSWRPAYQAEAGLRDDLSNNVSLFGEYRFSQSEAGEISDGVDSAHQHFADHGLLAGLTYHLND